MNLLACISTSANTVEPLVAIPKTGLLRWFQFYNNDNYVGLIAIGDGVHGLSYFRCIRFHCSCSQSDD